MQSAPDQHRADRHPADGPPTSRLELVSGRLLLAGVVISELACVALVAALVL